MSNLLNELSKTASLKQFMIDFAGLRSSCNDLIIADAVGYYAGKVLRTCISTILEGGKCMSVNMFIGTLRLVFEVDNVVEPLRKEGFADDRSNSKICEDAKAMIDKCVDELDISKYDDIVYEKNNIDELKKVARKLSNDTEFIDLFYVDTSEHNYDELHNKAVAEAIVTSYAINLYYKELDKHNEGKDTMSVAEFAKNIIGRFMKGSSTYIDLEGRTTQINNDSDIAKKIREKAEFAVIDILTL